MYAYPEKYVETNGLVLIQKPKMATGAEITPIRKYGVVDSMQITATGRLLNTIMFVQLRKMDYYFWHFTHCIQQLFLDRIVSFVTEKQAKVIVCSRFETSLDHPFPRNADIHDYVCST